MPSPEATSLEGVSLATHQAVDRICTDFERAWQKGDSPQLEDYCAGLSSGDNRLLFQELLHLEVTYRRQRGEAVELADYLRRFPEQAEALPALWPGPENTATDLSETPRAGRLPAIAGYEVQRELGRGGMGVVYLARDPRLGRLVALKVLAGPVPDANALRRFRTEAEAVARLQHPNIVQVYEIGEWDAGAGHPPVPYLALEYVAGGSLDRHTGGTPQPCRDSARLVETLARAVQAAHEAGIVHRDLKPANVLMVRGEWSDGESTSLVTPHPSPLTTPKIADFGLAKRLDGEGTQTQTGMVVGTPCYMAPEQGEKSWGEVGPASDVYALGAILYELLTGRPPFKAATPVETLWQVLNTEPVPPSRLQPKLPRDLESICLKCLEKGPAQRYPSAADLAEDLRRFQAGEPVRARPISLARRLAKWARRRPAVASLLGACVLAALALLGVWAKFTADIRNERNAKADLADFAQQQKEKAEGNYEEAERQRRLAVASLEKARQAARDVYNLVAHDRDLKAQGLEPLRRQLIARTGHLYESLVEDFAQFPELQNERAQAFHILGQLTLRGGLPAEAIPHLEKAIGIGEELVAAHPAQLIYRQVLAMSWVDLGECYRQLGRPEDAEKAYRRAVDYGRQATELAPSNEQSHFHLALYYCHLGRLLNHANRYPEAEAVYVSGITAIEKALEQASITDYFNTLAMVHNNLAGVYERTGRRVKTLAALRRAVAIREKLVERAPDYAAYQEGLAVSLHRLATLLGKLHQPSEAQAAFSRAIQLRSELAQRHPAVPEHREYLAQIYLALGAFHKENGRPAEAVAACRQAIQYRHALVDLFPTSWPRAERYAASLVQVAGVTDARKDADLTERLADAIRLMKAWAKQPEAAGKVQPLLQALEQARGKATKALGTADPLGGAVPK